MRRMLMLSTAILIAAGPLWAKGGAPLVKLGPGNVSAARALAELRALHAAKGIDSLLPSKGGPTCNELDPERIECGSTTTGTLLATDCLLDDDTVFDVYAFDGDDGDQVEIGLTSSDFDTVAFLLDPGGGVFVFDDDGGGGTDSHISAVLNASGTWTIVVNNFAEDPGDPGAYTLSFDCVSANCVQTATAMCLNRGRFRVEVAWTDFQGASGSAQRVLLPVTADDSGVFYFFSPDNWEMLIKVLTGCGINNHYWVFGAATTNVEYTVRVTDTETGQVKTFHNPLGVAPPAITSTDAFATCP